MDFLSSWGRVKDKTNLCKLNQLADFVGVSQQFVSKKKKENSFPIEWAFKVATTYNLSTDWIMRGEGKENRSKDDFFLQLESWAKETTGSNDITAIKNMIDQCLPMFKQWRKRREEQESSGDSSADKKIA